MTTAQVILGYYNHKNFKVRSRIVCQSPDIAQGVDTGGAGDQGIMVGYATNETKSMMPLEYELARQIADYVFRTTAFGPDGKCQVTIGDTGYIQAVIISAQTKHGVLTKKMIEDLLGKRINNFYFNPTGRFEVGGFAADTGLTGRKIAIDNYGPQVPIGGGAFSGKDASKVDRSAAYMARYLAKHYLVNNPEEKEAIVKIAYSIGIAEPVMVTVNGISNLGFAKKFDLTPSGISKFLDLKKPIFERTARRGHFGDTSFKWEQL